jgi:hypothetical protein
MAKAEAGFRYKPSASKKRLGHGGDVIVCEAQRSV